MKKHVFILSLFVIVFAACSYHQGKERRNIVAPPKVHRKYESKCDEKSSKKINYKKHVNCSRWLKRILTGMVIMNITCRHQIIPQYLSVMSLRLAQTAVSLRGMVK